MKTLFRAAIPLFALALPSLSLGADAPLSHEQVKSTVDGHIGDVKSCMKDHGGATGKLVVEFAIDPDGKVKEARPKESSSNGALDKCIAKAFTRWTFPKPAGGAIMGVVYPFMFAPAPTPKAPPPGTPGPNEGHLTEAQIVDTVHSKQSDLKACIDDFRKNSTQKEATIAGQIDIGVVVSTQGAVKDAGIRKSTTGLATFDQCVVAKFKSWTFPKPAGNGEAAFVYPMLFNAERQTATKANSQAVQH